MFFIKYVNMGKPLRHQHYLRVCAKNTWLDDDDNTRLDDDDDQRVLKLFVPSIKTAQVEGKVGRGTRVSVSNFHPIFSPGMGGDYLVKVSPLPGEESS
jgi:hypothetical protein